MFQVVGFDSEEQRRWQQVVVRRGTVCGPWVRGSMVGGVEVEFDSSGAEEEWVSAVAAVNEVEHIVVSSHPAQRKSSRWGLVTLVETGALQR